MKINRALLPLNKEVIQKEEIDFTKERFSPSSNIKSIDHVEVEAHIFLSEDFLRINIKVKSKITAICAYSLEDVPLKVNFQEELHFTNEEDSLYEDAYLVKDNLFSLDEYILSFIISSVPVKVIKEGKKIPESGKGYRVLSEEDYLKEKSEKKVSPFDCLDDLEL